MLPVAEAESIILNLVQPLNAQEDTEVVGLWSAAGRILAEIATSELDFPHWDNSAMDGYAVRFEDVQLARAEHPVNLEVIEAIPAGHQPQHPIQPGQCARIFTGSMLPEGADTIVIQEHTQRQGNFVTILQAPAPQAYVRYRGDYYKAGQTLLSPGSLLSAPELAVLAAAQCSRVSVYRRPRVALLSTGNELVSVDQPLQPGQIVDSNQVALTALVAQTGAEPVRLGIIPDQQAALAKTIAQAIAQAEIVISSGGVSVGDYDYVEEILTSLGATLCVRAVAMKPGKPLTVAHFPVNSERQRSILYFGLPGNPVSALVTFWRFVQPALRKLAGLSQGWEPVFVSAIAAQDLQSDGKRESYVWGQLQLIKGTYRFQPAQGSHSSGNLINLAGTNGLAVIPIGQTHCAAGETIRVMQVGSAIQGV